jgi:tRNA G46 methylase TrmB
MTKSEIAQHLVEIGFGSGKPAVQAAIAYIAKKNPPAKSSAAQPVKAPATTAA